MNALTTIISLFALFSILPLAYTFPVKPENIDPYNDTSLDSNDYQMLWAASFSKDFSIQSMKSGVFNPCMILKADPQEPGDDVHNVEEVGEPDSNEWERQDLDEYDKDDHEEEEAEEEEEDEPLKDTDQSKLFHPTRPVDLEFQSLPEDEYSVQYLESLQEIGIQKIAESALGITYSFYTDFGGCKMPEDIIRDVELLKSFEIIRAYDVDCDGIKIILSQLQPYQRVFAGIYYLERLDESIETLIQAVRENRDDWDKIHTVSVGNELVNFDKATVEDIKYAVERTRELLSEEGYDGPVVSTDTLVAMMHHPELCQISDYISFNSHPYWDGNVKAQEAGDWLVAQIEHLKQVCGPDKKYLLSEVGWPTQGSVFGASGIPSYENQIIALKSIVEKLNGEVILFTMFNDLWKDEGVFGVEKYWGVLDQ